MIRAEIVTVQEAAGETLPALIDRAARALSSARSSAEVLEARELAGFAIDAAVRSARLARVKQAHDEVIIAAHRAKADALLIQHRAETRIADEIEAARDRGEVATDGRPKTVSDGNGIPATAAEIGFTRKMLMEARRARDAEKENPGVVERALNEAVERGDEPSRADIKRAVTPKEYWTERAAVDERDRLDKRDFKAFCKLWRTMSSGAKAQARAFIAAER